MAEAEKHSKPPPRFDSSQYNKSDEGMGLAPGYYLRDVTSHIELHFLTQRNTCSLFTLVKNDYIWTLRLVGMGVAWGARVGCG